MKSVVPRVRSRIEPLEHRRMLAAAIAPSGAITGVLYHDANQSGRHDWGEAVLAGWTVFSDKNGDGLLSASEPSTQTAPDGRYRLSNLPAGLQRVRAQVRAGWAAASPLGGAQTVSLAVGQITRGRDIGFRGTGTISGLAFDDRNADGRFDYRYDDTALSFSSIYIDANNNGRLDSNETASGNTRFGDYRLANVPPGQHNVRISLLPGWVRRSGGNGGIAVSLAPGAWVQDRNFAVRGTGSLSVRVFEDVNGNGRMDGPREVGLPGVKLQLYGWSPYPVRSTAADGRARFGDLPPRGFRLEIVDSGYGLLTKPTTVYQSLTWQVTSPLGNAEDGLVYVWTGQPDPVLNVGLQRVTVIAARSYVDNNRNGENDEGNPQRRPFDFYIDLNNDGTLDAGEPSYGASASEPDFGFTTIAGSIAGPIVVRQVLPPGWKQTQPAVEAYHINAVAGRTYSLDFGAYAAGTVAGRSYVDANRNGRLDAGDTPLRDREVYLDHNENGWLDPDEPRTLTNAVTGQYRFDDVSAGRVVVRQTHVPGWIAVRPGSETHEVNLEPGATLGTLTSIATVTAAPTAARRGCPTSLFSWTSIAMVDGISTNPAAKTITTPATTSSKTSREAGTWCGRSCPTLCVKPSPPPTRGRWTSPRRTCSPASTSEMPIPSRHLRSRRPLASGRLWRRVWRSMC
jgi:serine-aspartate repeat-containing protein C/D/E